MGLNLCVARACLALTCAGWLTSSLRRLMQIFIADRSPFSAVYYAAHGHLLEPLIREQMKEVMADAGVEMMTVYIQVEWTVLVLLLGCRELATFDTIFTCCARALLSG